MNTFDDLFVRDFDDCNGNPYTVKSLKRDIAAGRPINERLLKLIIWGDLPTIAEVVETYNVGYHKGAEIRATVVRVDSKLYGVLSNFDNYEGTTFNTASFVPTRPCIKYGFDFP